MDLATEKKRDWLAHGLGFGRENENREEKRTELKLQNTNQVQSTKCEGTEKLCESYLWNWSTEKRIVDAGRQYQEKLLKKKLLGKDLKIQVKNVVQARQAAEKKLSVMKTKFEAEKEELQGRVIKAAHRRQLLGGKEANQPDKSALVTTARQQPRPLSTLRRASKRVWTGG